VIYVSDRAKRLIEALHEPFTNEQRWDIAQEFLDEQEQETALKFLEGSAQLARQSGLNPEAPDGVESSTLSPSANDCGCHWNSEGFEHGA